MLNKFERVMYLQSASLSFLVSLETFPLSSFPSKVLWQEGDYRHPAILSTKEGSKYIGLDLDVNM